MAIELPDISKFQKRVEEIDGLMNQPDFFNDARRSAALSREQIKLRQLLEDHAALESAKAALAEHKELLADPNGDEELKELALDELPELEEQVAGLESKILVSMIPPDDSDSRNTIVEIRAGAGGDEASLFAGSLYRMYTRLAERRGWSIEACRGKRCRQNWPGSFTPEQRTLRGSDLPGLTEIHGSSTSDVGPASS